MGKRCVLTSNVGLCCDAGYVITAHADLTLRRLHYASDQVHQRALPCAVASKQAQYFSTSNLEGHTLQSFVFAKSVRDVVDIEARVGCDIGSGDALFDRTYNVGTI
jgi:hypothetical protein